MLEDLAVAVVLQAAEDARRHTHLDAQFWLQTTGLDWAMSLGVDPDVYTNWVRSGCKTRL